jgi:hypothetical protein
MKAFEFCYWLQGYFELVDDVDVLHADQVEKIKNHLNMVFLHDIDKTYPQGTELQDLHDGVPPQFKPQPDGLPKLRC